MTGTVRIDVREDGVALLTLDRPGKLNSVTDEMSRELTGLVARVDADEDIRVAVLTGAGDRSFCVGSDIGEVGEYAGPWPFRNRRDVGIERDIDPAEPGLGAQLRQAIVRFAESGSAFHVRRRQQRTVEAIAPCMVRADDRGGAAAPFQQNRHPMQTDIGKRTHVASPVTHDDDRLTGDLIGQICARFGDRARPTDADPFLAEQVLLLGRQHIR